MTAVILVLPTALIARADSTGAVFADVDGDRDLDLLVTGLGSGARLFVNDGKGKFAERTVEAGLKSKAGSMSMALAASAALAPAAHAQEFNWKKHQGKTVTFLNDLFGKTAVASSS